MRVDIPVLIINTISIYLHISSKISIYLSSVIIRVYICVRLFVTAQWANFSVGAIYYQTCVVLY